MRKLAKEFRSRLAELRRVSIVATLALTVVVVTACGAPENGPPPKTDGVIIVTNSRANVPQPRLSSENAKLISAVLVHKLPVQIVSADGTPEPVQVAIPNLRSCSNEHSCNKVLADAMAKIQLYVTALPNSDGANGYGAVAVARDAAQSLKLKKPTIICLFCGLETEGALAMTAEGAVRADAQDYVDHLKATGQLVTFEAFEEATVVLTGAGYTAPPQEPLSASDRDNLTAIWTAVLTGGGATVVPDPFPVTGESIRTDHTVPVIVLAAKGPIDPKVCDPAPVVFDGASSARFVAETDSWADQSAAREALRPLAVWLRAEPGRTAIVEGTTADIQSGDPEEGKDLSRRRAFAARAMLIELGVDADQIVRLEGLGPNYPGRVADRSADGTPIPSERLKNRKVIITLLGDC